MVVFAPYRLDGRMTVWNGRWSPSLWIYSLLWETEVSFGAHKRLPQDPTWASPIHFTPSYPIYFMVSSNILVSSLGLPKWSRTYSFRPNFYTHFLFQYCPLRVVLHIIPRPSCPFLISVLPVKGGTLYNTTTFLSIFLSKSLIVCLLLGVFEWTLLDGQHFV